MGGRRAGGGMSIGTIIFLVVIYFVFKAMGIDLLQVMGDGGGQVSMPGFEQTESASRRASPQEEERKAFMATVLAEARDKASKESQRILEAGRLQLEAERAQLVHDLRGEVGGMATVLAGKIVGEKSPETGEQTLGLMMAGIAA